MIGGGGDFNLIFDLEINLVSVKKLGLQNFY